MKYLSIDIETTGLADDADVVEVGIVADAWDRSNLDNPGAHYFQAYVHPYHKTIDEVWQNAEPFARDLHESSGLRSRWYSAPPLRKVSEQVENVSVRVDMLCHTIITWLCWIGFFSPEEAHKKRINVAGKNIATFDWPRLKRLPCWDLTARHRMLDPGPLYLRPREDEKIPDQSQCLARAGLPTSVSHHALEDAMQVVWLLRHHYLGQSPEDFATPVI